MSRAADSWTVLDERAGVLTREYSFAPHARARCFVARFGDGELLVVSPPTRLKDEDFKALEKFGRVTALVAPNGFHHLGLADFKAAFPDAKIYAPAAAAKRISKKNPSVGPLLPLEQLQARLTPGVQVLDVPGFSVGETWVSAQTERGRIWYVSDSCFSMPQLPKPLPLKLIFKWSKSAPGFQINGLGKLLFLRDRQTYKQWFLDQLKQPPSVVVTAHGAIVEQPNLGATLTSMVNDRL